MTEELEIMKPRRGRPKKETMTIQPVTEAEPCPVCDAGWIEIEEEDENGEITTRREQCDYCHGTGLMPVGAFEPDDVSDADIAAIERSLGYTTRAWGFIDPRMVIAAVANRMGNKPVPA
jgi:hypothetical protein